MFKKFKCKAFLFKINDESFQLSYFIRSFFKIYIASKLKVLVNIEHDVLFLQIHLLALRKSQFTFTCTNKSQIVKIYPFHYDFVVKR